MTEATVLLYNFTEQEIKAWRFLLKAVPGVRLVSVPKSAYGIPILDVIAGKTPPPLCYGRDFSEKMILLANATDQMIHVLLAVCKQVTDQNVLRAVLTETNGAWTSSALYEELRAEENELRRMQ